MRRLWLSVSAAASFMWTGGDLSAQSGRSPLVSRMELTATAARADSLAGVGDESARVRNAMLAAGFHRRLRDGDFQVGDRIVVTIVSDAVHRDTAVVRPGGLLELPGNIVVPIHGVLRSELHDRVATEVLKLVKASEIQVTALMRVGVLGEVARPGYFAFAPDIPITDAIMGAGGPTAAADLARTTVRRGNQAYRSSDETRKAIAGGLTLDEFGLNAGDELVIGQRSSGGASTILGFLGAFGSVAAVYVALHRR